MADVPITYKIPSGKVAEVKAAIDHHVGSTATEGWDNADYRAFLVDRARSDARQLVRKYRESQVTVEEGDPTAE